MRKIALNKLLPAMQARWWIASVKKPLGRANKACPSRTKDEDASTVRHDAPSEEAGIEPKHVTKPSCKRLKDGQVLRSDIMI